MSLPRWSPTGFLEFAILAAQASRMSARNPGQDRFPIGKELADAGRVHLQADEIFAVMNRQKGEGHKRQRTWALLQGLLTKKDLEARRLERGLVHKRRRIERTGLTYETRGYVGHRRGGNRYVLTFTRDCLEALLKDPTVGPLVRRFASHIEEASRGRLEAGAPCGPRSDTERRRVRKSQRDLLARRLSDPRTTTSEIDALRRALTTWIEHDDHHQAGRDPVRVSAREVVESSEDLTAWERLAQRRLVRKHNVGRETFFYLNARIFRAYAAPEAASIRRVLAVGPQPRGH